MKRILICLVALSLFLQPGFPGRAVSVYAGETLQTEAVSENTGAGTGTADLDPADHTAQSAGTDSAEAAQDTGEKAPDTEKKSGWVKKNGRKYYYKRGKKVTGLKKISGNYYYFSKRGVLRKKNITVNGMKYLINKKNGKITGYVMKEKVAPICQQPELPSGCEIVAWTMMVKHARVKMNKMKAVKLMPRAANPNLGFVGSPFSSSGYSLVVYPGGLMSLTEKYLGSAVNLTGKPEIKLQNKIRKGHIVLAWVAGLDGFGSHTIALTGYDRERVYYNDPWTGTARTMPWSTFRSMWAGNGRRALSY